MRFVTEVCLFFEILSVLGLAYFIDGTEITYDSSFNSDASVDVKRHRRRRAAEGDDLEDLDLDESFDPEVIMILLL